MDYPSLAFRMIIIFGMYVVLQSGIAVNPYPTTPLKSVVIPQFADEDAQAERLTPEWAKAWAGTSSFLQHSPSVLPPSVILDDPEITREACGCRSFGRAGDLEGMLWNGFGAGEGGSVRAEHILTVLTAASCAHHEVQIELLICQLHHADEELIPKLL